MVSGLFAPYMRDPDASPSYATTFPFVLFGENIDETPTQLSEFAEIALTRFSGCVAAAADMAWNSTASTARARANGARRAAVTRGE